MTFKQYYDKIIKNSPIGFGFFKIITDDTGSPADFIFLDVNTAFETLIGYKAKNIINRKVTEVLLDIKKGDFNWIDFFGNIALNGGDVEFEQYAPALKKWFKVQVFSSEYGYFTTFFTDNTKERLLIESSKYFLEYDKEIPDYDKICNDVKILSGAKYVALNLFSNDAKSFTTVAISGLFTYIRKADKILGFNIVGRTWERDIVKELKIKDKVITVFKGLKELIGDVLPKSILTILENSFNIGHVIVVRIMKETQMLGDFTLFMPEIYKLDNTNLLEIYTQQLGLFLDKHRTENELKRFFTVNLDMLLISDMEARFIKLNPAWTEILGYTDEELKKRKFYDFIHPEDIALTQQVMNKLGEKEDVKGFINRYRCKDGSYRFIEWRAHPIGQYIYAAARDITKFIIAEKTLRENQQRYELISQNMGSIITMLDMNLNFLYVSPSIEKFTSYTPEEYKLLKLSQIMTPESYALVRNTIKNEMQLEATGRADAKRSFTLELQQYRKDGKLSWVEVVVTYMRNPDSSIYAFLTVGKDISDRKLAEQELKLSEEKYRLITENISDVIWVLNLNQNRFTFISPSVFELRGLLPEEALEESLEDIIPDEYLDEVNKMIALYLQKFLDKEDMPSHIIYQLQQYRKDKSLVWVEISFCYRYNKDNEVELIGISRNIENRKQLQNELIIAKEIAESASKAKSEFLANMSHEIRTPLNSLIGFADLLRYTPLSLMQKQYVDNINTSAQSLLGVISDILDFSKIEAGKMELDLIKADIIELCEQATDIVKYQASQKDIELLLNIPSDIPRMVVVDPVRFKQLLLNLLNNAIKFTPKGEVELKVEFIKLNQKKGRFILSIRDTGIGINTKDKSKLFKAFSQADTSTTRQFGGTGLGLIISNFIATRMGSGIEWESEPGKGSIFKFSFETTYEFNEKIEQKNIRNIKRVLVIDDNEKNRMILEHMFKNWGINFSACEDGISAFKMIKQSEPFDVIIVDYKMPFMDGLETIKMIRNNLPLTIEKMPVILLHSSVDDSKIYEQCKKMSVRYNIIKPVKSKELYNYLKNINNTDLSIKDNKYIKESDSNGYMNFDALMPVILIAEDVKMNQEVVKAIMLSIIPNAIILEASNGNDVIELLKKHKTNIVFMDVQMPYLDGIEATKAIRSMKDKNIRNIPVVALTAGATKEEKEKCKKAGMNDFITKPIEKYQLLRIIKTYINEDYNKKMKNKKENIVHFNKDRFNYIIGDDNVLGEEMLKIAKIQINQLLSLLEAAIIAGNVQEIKSVAHKLAGTTLNMCFDNMTQITQDIEKNYQNESKNLNLLLKKIIKEWDILKFILFDDIK